MTAGFAIGHLHSDKPYDISVPPANPADPWREIDIRLAEPQAAKLLIWQARINDKYRAQLGQDLTWNEDSAYRQRVDLPLEAQTALFYAAAIVDLFGEEQLAAKLKGRATPPKQDLPSLHERIGQRGYLCRFPQFLLNVGYWLPFRRDLIIEDLDWDGQLCRFGSLPSLTYELDVLMRLLSAAKADKTLKSPLCDQALLCGKALSALAAIADDKQLPLWRTA